MDFLQGEKYCSLGCVLTVLVKLKSILASQVSFSTHPIREYLIEKTDFRFSCVFKSANYSVASAFHPAFKFNLISDEASELVFKNKIEILVRNFQATPKIVSPLNQENFLIFQEENCQDSELAKFFNDRRENIEMLKDYSEILKIFNEYNTPIPLSATVERLFSLGSLVL